MAESGLCGCLVLVLLPVLIMQGFGCFSKHLMSTPECGDIGLLTQCQFDHCESRNDTYIYTRPYCIISYSAAYLEIVSFVCFLILSIYITWSILCSGEYDEEPACLSCLGCISMAMYPATGIMCVVGSGLVANSDNKPDGAKLGSAFYLSLCAGIYVILQMTGMVILLCCSEQDKDEDYTPKSNRTVATTESSGYVIERPTAVQVQTMEREEVVVSNGMTFIRKMHLTRVVGVFRG